MPGMKEYIQHIVWHQTNGTLESLPKEGKVLIAYDGDVVEAIFSTIKDGVHVFAIPGYHEVERVNDGQVWWWAYWPTQEDFPK